MLCIYLQMDIGIYIFPISEGVLNHKTPLHPPRRLRRCLRLSRSDLQRYGFMGIYCIDTFLTFQYFNCVYDYLNFTKHNNVLPL